MSLNRFEQLVYDYVRGHADERQYWQDKVRRIVTQSDSVAQAAARLDGEFWRYFEERSDSIPTFRMMMGVPAPRRVSMVNLAELLIRLWVDPKPRPKSPPESPLVDP
ncbi:MAG TPA: hypothetical protein VGF85_09340 [Opitutaceae bacterium]|jgi:hypothetical protein